MNRPNITGHIMLKVTIDGKPYSSIQELHEAARYAYGPMALEGGCLDALRLACQEIWDRVRHEA